jgi:hypothetical protein
MKASAVEVWSATLRDVLMLVSAVDDRSASLGGGREW